jgi:TnpA family transposase
MKMLKAKLPMLLVVGTFTAANFFGNSHDEKILKKAQTEALKYETSQQLNTAKTELSGKCCRYSDQIHLYDSIAAEGKAKKAYLEGVQMVRDSIANATKNAVK